MENLLHLIKAREIMVQLGQDTTGIDTTINKLKGKVLQSPLAKIKELADAELNGFVDEVKILYTFKPGLTSTIEIWKPEVPKPIVKTNSTPTGGKQTKLKVTFADGTTFAEEKAADIFAKTIIKLGVDKCRNAVEALDIKLGPLPLICNQLPADYQRTKKDLGDGWWLLLDCKNEVKKEKIEQIAQYLGEKVKVEVYFPKPEKPSPKLPIENPDKPKRKGPQQGLKVTFPNGKIVKEANAVDTYCETIMRIGVDRVFEASMDHGITLNGVNIITDTKHHKYGDSQRALGHGWWLMTHSNTPQKKDVLEKLSHHLGLDLNIEMFEKVDKPNPNNGLFGEK